MGIAGAEVESLQIKNMEEVGWVGGWTGNCSFHFSTRLKGGSTTVGVGRIHLAGWPQSII